MHDVVENELEQHLEGKASPAFYSHLTSCAECAEELESLVDVSDLLRELRPEAEVAPPPFFFNRVAAGIVAQERSRNWGILAPGAVFFRRMAFASLLLLAALGTYLVNREGDASGTDAATIMAQHDVTATHPDSSDRDLMLVTLAGYR